MAGRPRDDRTRAAILRQAADIASVEGLEGLTIGRLATDLGVSKSGLFGLFGSKEELQLNAIAVAQEVFVTEVVRPAMARPPGLDRVRHLCANWLSYSRRRVFPGGCFFFTITAEYDARTGRVHDAAAKASRAWNDLVTHSLTEARDLHELAPTTDPAQVAFELIAYLEAANASSLLHDDPDAYQRAETAIRNRLSAAATR